MDLKVIINAQKVLFAKIQDQNHADHIFFNKQVVIHKEFVHEWQSQ
jgi:hypothetical protein